MAGDTNETQREPDVQNGGEVKRHMVECILIELIKAIRASWDKPKLKSKLS